MFQDIWTIMQKEIKEYLASQQMGRRTLRGNILVYVGIFGLLLPLVGGAGGIEDGTTSLIMTMLPMLIVVNVIADSFAGERERQTLETLLASRLSDKTILYGKMLAAIAYGTATGWASATVSLIVINVMNAGGGLIMYPPLALLLILATGPTLALVAAAAGALISLRAATTRQAQQSVSLIIVFIFLPLAFLPDIIAWLQGQGFLRDFDMAAMAATVNPMTLVGIFMGVLAAAAVVLVLIAQARFKRARLILD